MTKNALSVVSLAVFLSAAGAARAQSGGMMHEGHGDHGAMDTDRGLARYRSPGLAVALSLTPVPIDFGNLYAENIAWGVGYSAVEIGLMVPMMFIVGGHMNGGMWGSSSASNYSPWTSGDRAAFIGLLSGYVVVKLVAGLHAGHVVDVHNQELAQAPRVSAIVLPTAGGGLAMATLRF